MLFNNTANIGYVSPYDSIFRKAADAGFFTYSVDKVKHEIKFIKNENGDGERYPSFLMKYELPDSNTIRLSGLIRKDSVLAVLKNTHRHFILTDTKMQWLKEDK